MIVGVLVRMLPYQPIGAPPMSYKALVGSLFTLFREERVLRVRALFGLLIFAQITTLLTPLVLPLSALPYSFSHTLIGLFGLAGAAGALAAARAGRWADQGLGERVTGIALMLMLAAWFFIGLMPVSIVLLIVGVVLLDFGLQAVHVTNQALIYRVRPEAQSRLTAAYMVFYSIGSALGASVSTLIYASCGWLGVSLLGATVAVAAIILWYTTLLRD